MRNLRFAALFFIVLSLSGRAFAQMQFPPVLTTEQEIAEYAARIRLLVPEVANSGNHTIDNGTMNSKFVSLIRAEQQLVNELKRNSSYMREANARPPLQTFIFEKVVTEYIQGDGLNARWTEFLEHSNFSADRSIAEINSELTTLFETWRKTTSIGFFSGWARLLPDAVKREVLAEPDLLMRWQRLRAELARFELPRLRADFKAELFGVTNANWTLEDLDQVVAGINTVENRLAIVLQELYIRSGSTEPAWIVSDDPNEILTLIDANNLAANRKLLPGLTNRLQKLYVDTDTMVRVERPVRQLILRELPPYLAIYRGCVGNDCSTSHSWAFPYSFAERDWWVEDMTGRHLGYVSGNITTVDNEPCLYIRDISGGGLSNNWENSTRAAIPRTTDIELILNGFYLARQYYGASGMTFVSRVFTAQNHHPWQKERLANFAPSSVEVEQNFRDVGLRNVLGNRENTNGIVSGLSYDEVGKHSTVRYLLPDERSLEGYRVRHFDASQATPLDLSQSPEAFWDLLLHAVNTNVVSQLESSLPARNGQWREVVDAIRNVRREPMDQYYERVQTVFRKYNLPFSKNLVKTHDEVFRTGHMFAPDAFEGEKNVRQTVRYVISWLWSARDQAQAAAWISEHLDVFETNDTMIRAVNQIFKRQQVSDTERLNLLWQIGYRFRRQQLDVTEAIWVAAAARTDDLKLWAFEHLVEQGPNLIDATGLNSIVLYSFAALLINHDEHVDENISVRAAALIYNLKNVAWESQAMTEIEASIVEEDNLQIQFPLSVFYIRQILGSAIHDEKVAAIAFGILRDHADDPSLPSNWRNDATFYLRRLPIHQAQLLATRWEQESRLIATQCEQSLNPRPPK